MDFGALCDAKLGRKAVPEYSPYLWMGNQGMKAEESFPAALLPLDCSVVGFYPEQAPGAKLSFGILRLLHPWWGEQELTMAAGGGWDSKKLFSQKIYE